MCRLPLALYLGGQNSPDEVRPTRARVLRSLCLVTWPNPRVKPTCSQWGPPAGPARAGPRASRLCACFRVRGLAPASLLALGARPPLAPGRSRGPEARALGCWASVRPRLPVLCWSRSPPPPSGTLRPRCSSELAGLFPSLSLLLNLGFLSGSFPDCFGSFPPLVFSFWSSRSSMLELLSERVPWLCLLTILSPF